MNIIAIFTAFAAVFSVISASSEKGAEKKDSIDELLDLLNSLETASSFAARPPIMNTQINNYAVQPPYNNQPPKLTRKQMPKKIEKQSGVPDYDTYLRSIDEAERKSRKC